MTTIGTFEANGNEYTGEIANLTIRARNVSIVSAKRNTDAGPSHRVYAGDAEVGAGWSKRSKEGRPSLSFSSMIRAFSPRSTPACWPTRTARPTTWSGRGATVTPTDWTAGA